MTKNAVYISEIFRYLDGDKKDFYPLGNFRSKRELVECLEKFKKSYPERELEINFILDNIDELLNSKYTHEHFIKMIEFRMVNKSANYLRLIYEVLSRSEEEAVNRLMKLNVNFSTCSSTLVYTKKNFGQQTEEIEFIESVFNKYKEKRLSNIDQNKYINVPLVDEENSKLSSDAKELYESNCSIEEYCSITGKRINPLRKECEKYRDGNDAASKIIAIQILSRDNTEFYKYITNCIYELLQIEDLDIIDYYERTRLLLNDLRDIVDIIGINNNQVKDLIVRLKQIQVKTNKTTKYEQFNSKTIISGTEITRDEKERIFNYLDNNNIPYNACYTAYKRYVSGNLDLSKTLVKKVV